MKIALLRIGTAETQTAERILENLGIILTEAEFALAAETMSTPKESYDTARNQYRSDIILHKIRAFATKNMFDRVLGIIDVDIFVPELNFVFGEAEHPGKAALISLVRLRPEFYGRPANFEVFADRAVKEAAHELGHTLGLSHCSNPFCVMYFSNSIFETDRKQSLFCSKCYLQVEAALKQEEEET